MKYTRDKISLVQTSLCKVIDGETPDEKMIDDLEFINDIMYSLCLDDTIGIDMAEYVSSRIDDEIIIEAHYQIMKKYKVTLTPHERYKLASEDIDTAMMYLNETMDEIVKDKR